MEQWMANGGDGRVAARRTGLARAIAPWSAPAAVAAALALAGCSSGLEPAGLSVLDLPEGAEVESAPWPRLVDSPAPTGVAATPGQSGAALRSDAIRGEIGSDADLLREEAAALERARVANGALRREARDALALNSALEARDREVAATEQRTTITATPTGEAAPDAAAPDGAPSEADRIRAELEAELNAAE